MKKRWLKVLTIACVTALSVSTFLGCGNKGKEDAAEGKSKELNIAVFEGGFGKAYWEEAIKKFEEANEGVKVNMEVNPKIGDIIRPKLAAGDAPDFIYLSTSDPSGIPNALIKDKGLEDLTDVFEREDPDNKGKKLKDKILPGFLDTPLTAPYGDNKVFLAPLYYNVTGMWYNKALFKEKGWEVPKTWDEFFALGEKAKSEGIALYTYQGQSPGYNEAVVYPMIASAAGQEALEKIFNYEEGSLNNDGVKKALKVFEDMANKDMVLKGTVAMSHTQAQIEFLKGNALFLPCGNWLEGEMKDSIPEGFEFGFMAPPTFNVGEKPYVTTQVEQMYIPKDAKNKELAKDFLAFQYTDELVKLNAEKAKAVVPVKGAVANAKGIIDESGYDSFKVVEDGATPITLAFASTNSKIKMNDSILKPIGSVINKEMTIDKWVEQIEKDAKDCKDNLIK